MSPEKIESFGTIRPFFYEKGRERLSLTVPTSSISKMKDEMKFENQLLVKPSLTEHISKIRISKRKFNGLKLKGNLTYCPWGNHEHDEEEFDLRR